jgi:hypothetical protein
VDLAEALVRSLEQAPDELRSAFRDFRVGNRAEILFLTWKHWEAQQDAGTRSTLCIHCRPSVILIYACMCLFAPLLVAWGSFVMRCSEGRRLSLTLPSDSMSRHEWEVRAIHALQAPSAGVLP